jgi:uncharacterized protein YbaR (Trm112 family)
LAEGLVAAMINKELLDILRCPMDPSNTCLTLEGDRLICQRCGLRFNIKDGFPILVVEEAELPPGVSSLAQLPCQLAGKTGTGDPTGPG